MDLMVQQGEPGHLLALKRLNSNHAADKSLATRVQKATFNAIKAHDINAKDRKVKDKKLDVLNEASLGVKARGLPIGSRIHRCWGGR